MADKLQLCREETKPSKTAHEVGRLERHAEDLLTLFAYSDGRLVGVSRNSSIGAKRDARAQRWMMLSTTDCLHIDLGPVAHKAAPSDDVEDEILSDAELRDLEHRNLVAALKLTGWKISGPGGAAELLGVKSDGPRDMGFKS